MPPLTSCVDVTTFISYKMDLLNSSVCAVARIRNILSLWVNESYLPGASPSMLILKNLVNLVKPTAEILIPISDNCEYVRQRTN